MYASGYFGYIGTQNVPSLAQINSSNGKASSWNANASGAYSISTIFAKDSTLYVAGSTLYLGGGSRYGLAALSTNTALLRPFNANLGYSDAIHSINAIGKDIYIGGSFGGYPQRYIAALDSGTGKTDSSFFATTNAQVNSLSVAGDTIFAGGYFSIVDPIARPNIAVIDADSLKVTSFKFAGLSSGSIKALALNETGDTLYYGGNFSGPIGALRASDATILPWGISIDSEVTYLATRHNNLFIAGKFSKYYSTSVKGAIAISPRFKGLVWNANTTGGRVKSLALNNGRFYVGGNFKYISGNSDPYLESYLYSTYNSDQMGANLSDSVSLLIGKDSNVYSFGAFHTLNYQVTRNYAASFDENDNLRSWDANPDGNVTSAAFSTSNIYVSGNFDNIGGNFRNGLAALDTITGQSTSWISPVTLNTPLTGMEIIGSRLFGIENQNVLVIGICDGQKLQLLGNSTCGGSSGKIAIIKSVLGASYNVYLKGKNIGISANGNGDTVSISIPASYLTSAKNTFTIQASGLGCSNQITSDTVSILTNVVKSNIKIAGETICSGNGTVTLSSSQSGIVYEAYLNAVQVAADTAKDSSGLSMSVPSSSLRTGRNFITIKAVKLGCTSIIIPDTAVIQKINSLNQTNTITGDTICTGSVAYITVLNADPGVNYKVGNFNVSGYSDTGGSVILAIPASSLSPGIDTFSITASNKNCGTVIENNKAIVIVESSPSKLSISASTRICGSSNGYVYVNNSLFGSTYYIAMGANKIGSAMQGNGASIRFDIPSSNFKTGLNTVYIYQSSPKCNTVLSDSATITLTANCGQNDAGIVSITNPTGSICQGKQNVNVELINTGTSDLTSTGIGWSVNNSVQTSYSWTGKLKTDSTVIVSPGVFTFDSGKYAIKVWSYQPNGITDSNPYNDTALNIITILQLPGAYTGSSKQVCIGNSTGIGGQAISGNSYFWTSRPSGFTSTDASPNVSPTITTTYTLKESIISAGCSKSDSVVVIVNPNPDAYWTASENQNTIRFIPDVLNSKSYFWRFGDGDSSNLQGPSETYTSTGKFVVSLVITNSSGCTSEYDSAVTLNFTGTDIAKSQMGDIDIYPNPFCDQTTISYFLFKSAGIRIEISDMNGRTIAVPINEHQPSGSRTYLLDATKYNLSAGTYFIKIDADGQEETKKIIRLK